MNQPANGKGDDKKLKIAQAILDELIDGSYPPEAIQFDFFVLGAITGLAVAEIRRIRKEAL